MLAEKFYKQLVTGYEKLSKESSEQEKTKIHTLRGANSGCITEEGQIVGADPRTTVLRYLGIQIPTTIDDELLFQAGHANEDMLADWMTSANMSFRREEECPVKWECSYGGKTSPVSGRPDFIVNNDDGTPAYGIELKGIFGTGTLVEVAHFCGSTPKPVNVCQAAHYSWQNDKLPWLLQYVNRGYHNVFYFGTAKFPVNHRAVKRDEKTGKQITVGPFTTIYELTWDEDTLLIDDQPSIITSAGIQRYYEYILKCIATKTIPQAHDSIDVWGNKLKKDKSKLYYDFADCRTDSWDNWLEDCFEKTQL